MHIYIKQPDVEGATAGVWKTGDANEGKHENVTSLSKVNKGKTVCEDCNVWTRTVVMQACC